MSAATVIIARRHQHRPPPTSVAAPREPAGRRLWIREAMWRTLSWAGLAAVVLAAYEILQHTN